MSTVIDVVAPRLLGPAVMVAAAIIVKGYNDVGDGFSAGVIVALAIALRYVTLGTLELISAVAFDVGVFLLVCGVLVTLVHQLARLVEERGR